MNDFLTLATAGLERNCGWILKSQKTFLRLRCTHYLGKFIRNVAKTSCSPRRRSITLRKHCQGWRWRYKKDPQKHQT